MFSDRLASLRTKDEVDTLLGEIDVFRDSLYKTKGEVKKDPELDRIEKSLKAMEIVQLTLAYELGPADIEAFFKAAGKILDISKDARILGGAIVSYKGKYEDHSLRKKLDEFLITNF